MLFGFNDHNDEAMRNSDGKSMLGTRLNYIFLLFASVLFFMAGVFNTERDLFSTAFWFDHMQIQQAGISANYLMVVSMASQEVGVTTIAIVESLGLWSAQIVLGFTFSQKGKWTETSTSLVDFFVNMIDGNDKWANVSTQKVTQFLALALFVVIDTFTDIEWLSGNNGNMGQAILVSIVFHSILSELALFVGGKLVIESVVRLISTFAPRGRRSQVPRNTQKKNRNNNQQNSRGRTPNSNRQGFAQRPPRPNNGTSGRPNIIPSEYEITTHREE